jgi:hypothetical protein
MIDEMAAMAFVESLAALPFFPAEKMARGAIAEHLRTYASTEAQLRRLHSLVFKFWKRWEGPGELRAAFCALYAPADGGMSYSGLYPEEGYPPLEPQTGRLFAGNMKAIDGLPPTPEEIARWKAEGATLDREYTRGLLNMASHALKALPAPTGTELAAPAPTAPAARTAPVTAEEMEAISRARTHTLDDNIDALAAQTRAAVKLDPAREPSEKEAAADHAGTKEMWGSEGVTREQARSLVQEHLWDLAGYCQEVEDRLTLQLYRLAPDIDRAERAVRTMRNNWGNLKRVAGL